MTKKGINRQARSRANKLIDRLPEFTVPQLRELGKAVGVMHWQFSKLKKAELIWEIRRVIGQGTFADRLNRFADKAEEFLGD